MARHCVRHDNEEASKLVFWEPTDGRVNRGRRPVSYIDNLKRDTGLDDIMEIKSIMNDRRRWKEIVAGARTKVRPR